jgi:hypothetical protein
MRRCRFVGTFCVCPSPGRPSARPPRPSRCWRRSGREHPPGNIFDAGVPQVYKPQFAAGGAFGCVTHRGLRRAQAGASRSPSAASWLGVSPPTRVGAANALVQDCNWRSNAHRCAALRRSAVAPGGFPPGVSYWLRVASCLGVRLRRVRWSSPPAATAQRLHLWRPAGNSRAPDAPQVLPQQPAGAARDRRAPAVLLARVWAAGHVGGICRDRDLLRGARRQPQRRHRQLLPGDLGALRCRPVPRQHAAVVPGRLPGGVTCAALTGEPARWGARRRACAHARVVRRSRVGLEAGRADARGACVCVRAAAVPRGAPRLCGTARCLERAGQRCCAGREAGRWVGARFAGLGARLAGQACRLLSMRGARLPGGPVVYSVRQERRPHCRRDAAPCARAKGAIGVPVSRRCPAWSSACRWLHRQLLRVPPILLGTPRLAPGFRPGSAPGRVAGFLPCKCGPAIAAAHRLP